MFGRKKSPEEQKRHDEEMQRHELERQQMNNRMTSESKVRSGGAGVGVPPFPSLNAQGTYGHGQTFNSAGEEKLLEQQAKVAEQQANVAAYQVEVAKQQAKVAEQQARLYDAARGAVEEITQLVHDIRGQLPPPKPTNPSLPPPPPIIIDSTLGQRSKDQE